MLQIVHQVPNIVGKRCTTIFSRQFWLDGQLVESCTAVFIEIEAEWHRFFFDSGILHWREGETRPTPSTASDDQLHYPIVDLEIPTSTIETLSLTESLGGKFEFHILFGNGTTFILTDQGDSSSCKFAKR